jgi:hypothetical protein
VHRCGATPEDSTAAVTLIKQWASRMMPSGFRLDARAIVYHGDVMNTTSPIEHATRDLERNLLVSSDA